MVFMLLAVAGQAQVMVNASDTQVCAGEEIMLTASGADLYSWTPVANLDTNAGDSVTFSAAAGNYTLTIVGFDTTLNDTDTVMIDLTVWSTPFLSISSSASVNNNFVCLGNSATLTASVSPSVSSFLWSPDSTLNTDTANEVVASPTSSTTYTLVVTDTNGCTTTQTQAVNVNPNHPTVIITVTDSSICPGSSTELKANGTGQTFVWSPAATLNTSTEQTVIASPLTNTTYSVTATSNGCETVESYSIEVLPAPTMSATQSSGGATIKLDEEDVITVTCAECIYYVWKFPDATLQTTSAVQSVSPNEPGAIPIEINGFGENGCKSTVTVIVNVDSSFAGTPFGIEEAGQEAIQVIQAGSRVNVTASQAIDQVSVYNLLGEMVFQSVGENRNTIEWTTGTQPAGVYVILARSGGEEISKKIYIQ